MSPAHQPILSIVGAVAVLGAFTGCHGASDVPPIEDLRVLDIRVVPPEVSVFAPPSDLASLDLRGADGAFTVPELAGTEVRFTALVAHPDLDATFTFDWTQCGAGFRATPCDSGQTHRLDQQPEQTLTVSWTAQVESELLDFATPEQLLGLVGGDPRDLFSGLRTHINLAVAVRAASIDVDTARLEASKRVTLFDPRIAATTLLAAQLSEPGAAAALQDVDSASFCVGLQPERLDRLRTFLVERTPNAAPTYTGVDFGSGRGVVTATTADRRDAELMVAPSERIDLTGHGGPAERFELIDDRCDLLAFTEELKWSWFASQGAISIPSASGPASTVTWTAPPVDQLSEPVTRVRIWSVLRDGRGGSDHFVFDLQVTK